MITCGRIVVLTSLTAAACCGASPLMNGYDGSAPGEAGVPLSDLSTRDSSPSRGDAPLSTAEASLLADAARPSDDGGHTDGPRINPDAGTFACGPALWCKLGTDYCFSSNFGDAGMSEWMCTPLQNCQTGDRCMCLLLQHQCFAGCRDDKGPIFFWCPR